MSKRHYYVRFPKEVPAELEHIYNKIVRHEEYIYEKDAMGSAILYGSEEELIAYNIAKYITNKEIEDNEHTEMCNRIAELRNALEMLKEYYPKEYEIIHLYYFSEKKITLEKIGDHYRISKQAIHKIMKNAYEHLKEYIIMNKKHH